MSPLTLAVAVLQSIEPVDLQPNNGDALPGWTLEQQIGLNVVYTELTLHQFTNNTSSPVSIPPADVRYEIKQ